jgi:two-component system chemotaxis sensor kinase CheA
MRREQKAFDFTTGLECIRMSEEEVPEEIRIFLLEAYENLDQVEQDLVTLEQSPGDIEILNSVFRAIHTIKGNSGFLALANLEGLCHSGETLLDRLRNNTLQLTPDMTTALLELVDKSRILLGNLESTGKEGEIDSAEIIATLNSFVE